MNIMEQFEQIEKFTKTELEIIDYIKDISLYVNWRVG